jgi:hypothetical protein
VTAFEVIARPTEFASSWIEVGPRDLYRACNFYFHLFTLAFLIGASLTYLDFYRGASEPRELALLGLQIGLAIPTLYILNFITRQRVSFSGVAQAVLYVDGIFIVLLTLASGALAYLSFQFVDRGELELDVISTEVERCLSSSSFVYWLIRGDLEFFNHVVPEVTEATTLAVVRQYFQYGLILPFCLTFARLIKARYGASVRLNLMFAALTYAFVVNATYFVLDGIHTTIAMSTPCGETAARRAYATYNPAMVVRQIGERVNGQLRAAFASRAPLVSSTANGLQIDLRQQRGAPRSEEQLSMLSTSVRSLYCENNTDFRLARAIGIPLLLVVRDADGLPLHQEQFIPSTCK